MHLEIMVSSSIHCGKGCRRKALPFSGEMVPPPGGAVVPVVPWWGAVPPLGGAVLLQRSLGDMA